MDFKIHETEEIVTVILSGNLTIDKAQELKELFQMILEKKKYTQVNIEKIEKIDVAGIQVLCAFHRTAKEYGVMVHSSTELKPEIKIELERAAVWRDIYCEKHTNTGCFYERGG